MLVFREDVGFGEEEEEGGERTGADSGYFTVGGARRGSSSSEGGAGVETVRRAGKPARPPRTIDSQGRAEYYNLSHPPPPPSLPRRSVQNTPILLPPLSLPQQPAGGDAELL